MKCVLLTTCFLEELRIEGKWVLLDCMDFCLWVVVGGGEERCMRCWRRGSMEKDCGEGGCGGRVVGLNPPSLCCWFD